MLGNTPGPIRKVSLVPFCMAPDDVAENGVVATDISSGAEDQHYPEVRGGIVKILKESIAKRESEMAEKSKDFEVTNRYLISKTSEIQASLQEHKNLIEIEKEKAAKLEEENNRLHAQMSGPTADRSFELRDEVERRTKAETELANARAYQAESDA